MISLAEAQKFVLDACPEMSAVSWAVSDALGCVVSSTIRAAQPVPPFANASRDGYALRSADTARASKEIPGRFPVVGTVMAGQRPRRAVGRQQVVRIMTGAPVPEGADAVCQLEDCHMSSDGAIVIEQPVAPGTAIRLAGEDVAPGRVLLQAGSLLTPAHLGVLAGQGMQRVAVHPRPRVGVISTGDELASDHDQLRMGQIRDTNRPLLIGLVEREGWQSVDLGISPDDEATISEVLDRGAACDALITSGGVSVGDRDVVRTVVSDRSGRTARSMQVAIRPAKPFTFGVLEDSNTPVFALPGNPVSAMVSFEMFVRPAIRRMAGHHQLYRPVVLAQASHAMPKRSDGKTHFVGVDCYLNRNGRWRVRSVGGPASHQLAAMSRANALAILREAPGVKRWDQLPVMLIEVTGLEAASLDWAEVVDS
jgi:molybdenum cofactor synthesis domain-containing protein